MTVVNALTAVACTALAALVWATAYALTRPPSRKDNHQ